MREERDAQGTVNSRAANVGPVEHDQEPRREAGAADERENTIQRRRGVTALRNDRAPDGSAGPAELQRDRGPGREIPRPQKAIPGGNT